MRQALAKENGIRKKFKATFSRIGKKVNYKGYSEETILLTSIMDLESNEVVADHVWFSYTIGFQKVNLTEGKAVEFEARIKAYKKGYVNPRYGMKKQPLDYKLSHPTKIKTLGG